MKSKYIIAVTNLVNEYIRDSKIPKYLIGDKINIDFNDIHQKITIYYGKIPKFEEKVK
mgnify:CR=1 FL=1